MLTAEQVAALLASVADQPVEAADMALVAAGVHAVVFWTGTDLDEDEQYWESCAVRDARAHGNHHHYWGRQWTGLAFYGPDAAATARHARYAAEWWNPGTWRITLGSRPEPGDVRAAEIASQLATAKVLAEAEEIANRASRVTVATGTYDPAALRALIHDLKQLAFAGGRPWPNRLRASHETGTVTCVWERPGAAQAASRYVAAVTARAPGSWTISTDGPIADT